MGFALSVLYFVTYYYTPQGVFGPLAAFRIELILAGLVFLVSLPALARSFTVKTPQSSALIGLAIAVFASVLIGRRWAGGAVSAFLSFLPNAYGYFLVCLHCNSKRKLRVLVLMLLLVCIVVIVRGYIDLRHVAPESSSAQQAAQSDDVDEWNREHPYLLAMTNDAGDKFLRLRGPGEINDPNDFGQLIACVVPLTFIFWRPKAILLNIVSVLLPVAVLLYGAYLTHSRGTLLALIALAIVAARRRIGTLPAAVLAGGLFLAASALQFTGGREISAESGADRTDLWGAGLQMLKTRPLFGVGFGNFAGDAGLTAHNSIVVCAGELGLFGLYFWSLFLFPTVRDAMVIASEGVSKKRPIVAEGLAPSVAREVETVDDAEIVRLGRLSLLSLTGYLVAGLFLSRAYVLTLFLLGGIAEVVFQTGLDRGIIGPRLPAKRLLMYAGGMTISLVLVMYVMVRVLNLIHRS